MGANSSNCCGFVRAPIMNDKPRAPKEIDTNAKINIPFFTCNVKDQAIYQDDADSMDTTNIQLTLERDWVLNNNMNHPRGSLLISEVEKKQRIRDEKKCQYCNLGYFNIHQAHEIGCNHVDLMSGENSFIKNPFSRHCSIVKNTNSKSR